ncbi:MAG: hypothetical protein IKY52_01535 [Clostridia bacterium]|nr:hypothetical protein [Clostridia bacterium]
MELYFLDRQFTAISLPVDAAISVVWSLRYHECGTFTAVLPLAGTMEDGAALLSTAARAVYLCDREHCGRIETLICREGLLHIEGRMLECLLYDRVAAADAVYGGTAAEAVLAVMAQWAGDLSFAVMDTTLPEPGGTVQVGMEAGENLGKWIHGLLEPLGASFTVTLADGRLRFALVQGTDRSLDSDPAVNRAVFSEEFGNIASLEEELYREDVCTRLYVEGGDGTVVTVETPEAAENPREGYKKTTDLRPEDFETEETYRAALVQRGKTLLAAAGERSRLSCVAESDVQPRYGVDYRLGDICEIFSPAMGIRMAVRLTALDMVCEGGTLRLYPFFGDGVVRLKTALTG